MLKGATHQVTNGRQLAALSQIQSLSLQVGGIHCNVQVLSSHCGSRKNHLRTLQDEISQLVREAICHLTRVGWLPQEGFFSRGLSFHIASLEVLLLEELPPALTAGLYGSKVETIVNQGFGFQSLELHNQPPESTSALQASKGLHDFGITLSVDWNSQAQVKYTPRAKHKHVLYVFLHVFFFFFKWVILC